MSGKNNLLTLLETKITQVERCKLNTIQANTLYVETLPSLLLQAVGFIEKLVENKKPELLDKRGVYNFNSNILNKIKKTKDIDSYMAKAKNNIIKDYKSILPKQEFLVAVDYLNHLTITKDEMEFRLASLKTHRDAFAHGKVNALSLSIISKHDYYIYFGLLLIIEEFIK